MDSHISSMEQIFQHAQCNEYLDHEGRWVSTGQPDYASCVQHSLKYLGYTFQGWPETIQPRRFTKILYDTAEINIDKENKQLTIGNTQFDKIPMEVINIVTNIKTIKHKVITILDAYVYYSPTESDIDNELRTDKDIIMLTVRIEGEAIKVASDELKDNKEVALAAVKQNGLALQHISHLRKTDKEIVLAAVKQNGLALQYVSPTFQSIDNDEFLEIVLAAVKQTGAAFKYAPPELQSNEDFIYKSVKQNLAVLDHIHSEYRPGAINEFIKDKKNVLDSALQNPLSLNYIIDVLWDGTKFDFSYFKNLSQEPGNNVYKQLLTAVKNAIKKMKLIEDEKTSYKTLLIDRYFNSNKPDPKLLKFLIELEFYLEAQNKGYQRGHDTGFKFE